MKIGFLGADWSFDFVDDLGFPTLGGAGWYRIHLPFQAFHERRFDVVEGSIPDTKKGWLTVKDWRGVEHQDCDVVVIQRWMHRGAADAIKRARSNGQAVVMDADDWYGGLRQTNPAFAGTHPRAGMGLVSRAHARQNKVKETTDFNRDHLHKAMAASTAVICSTPFLVDRFSKGDRPVYLCRNAIDLARWPRRPFATCGSNPAIGWTGDTTYRAGDLAVLKGVLEPFREKYDLRVVHGGSVEDAPLFADLAGVDVNAVDEHPMVPMSNYPSLLRFFQIGVIPLDRSPFNQAKSAVKGMEMAAAGVPFVASPSPEYIWLNEEHRIGRIAHSPKEWVRHLTELLDPEVRDAEAAFQRERIESLGIDVHWVDWGRALTGALVSAL